MANDKFVNLAQTPKPRSKRSFWSPSQLVLPAQIVSLIVLVIPLVITGYISLTDWTPTRGSLIDAGFIGLFNYEELLFYDTRFIEAVGRTLFISVISLSLEFLIGLGLAILFLRSFRGKRLIFSLLLTPMMVLPVVVGYTFWMLFQSNGPINQIIELLLGAGAAPHWFRSSTFAMVTVIVTEVWHWTPLFFLILLSGNYSPPAWTALPAKAICMAIMGLTPR